MTDEEEVKVEEPSRQAARTLLIPEGDQDFSPQLQDFHNIAELEGQAANNGEESDDEFQI